MSVFADLNPPYSTIVADPPWDYPGGWPMSNGQAQKGNRGRRALPYSPMTLVGIQRLPVETIAAKDAHLYLWTTSRYLRQAFDVLDAWDFGFSQALVWCKPPRGKGPGGAFSNTAEFVLFAKRGRLPAQTRIDRTWWEWSRQGHSVKPPAFLDIVESVSPGPYVELFAREPRIGWDSWGKGYEVAA